MGPLVLHVFLLMMTLAGPEGTVMVKVAPQASMEECTQHKLKLDLDLAEDPAGLKAGITFHTQCIDVAMPAPIKPKE